MAAMEEFRFSKIWIFMGTDDNFRKRKERKVVELERLQRERTKGPRFLIVCEGQKTEPYYFSEFCEHHWLRTPRVRISPGEYGSSPGGVVRYAVDLYDEDAKLGPDRYDSVFCVIDRDTHSTYDAAVNRIEELNAEGKPFVAIPSIPCFEYWLLLHFTYTRQPFHATGKKSICEAVIRELRKQSGFRGYDKGQKGIYIRLKEQTATAIKHAQRAEEDARKIGEDNPTTRIHKLVIELQDLAISHGRKR